MNRWRALGLFWVVLNLACIALNAHMFAVHGTWHSLALIPFNGFAAFACLRATVRS